MLYCYNRLSNPNKVSEKQPMSNFMTTKGKAISTNVAKKELKVGENNFRIVGDILRRYGYWLKSPAGNAVFMECLGFDRELEKFTNKVTDHIPTYFPHALTFGGEVEVDPKTGEPRPHRPKWAYVATIIDRDDNDTIKELHMKKTSFEELIKIASKRNPSTKKPFGDPTDVVDGWDICLIKEKTGPKPMNVKYSVDPFSPINGAKPLTEAELQAFEDSPKIADRYTVATPEEQLELLEKIVSGRYDAERAEKKGGSAATSDDVDSESVNELG